ncbi:MAG: ABC transporter substrate-binding protein [Halodesulfurarchaeum sp.]
MVARDRVRFGESTPDGTSDRAESQHTPGRATGSRAVLGSRRGFLGALGASGILALGGCLGATDNVSTTRTIVDGVGREVQLPESVDRVVGLGPGALRQIVYVDGVDRVVGVERDEREDLRTLPYNAAYPELRELPTVGSSGPEASGDAEKLLEAEPDVVFLSAIGGYEAAEVVTDQTGVQTVVLEMPFTSGSEGRAAYFESLRLVGTVLDIPGQAESIITSLQSAIEDLESRAPEESTAEAYAGGVSFKGSQGLTTTRVPYGPFELAGVGNVAAGIDADGVSVDVTAESLLSWDPSAIYCGAQNIPLVRQDLRRHPAIVELSAIQEGETFAMHPVSHYHENVGTMLVNAYYVGKTRYPEQFGDVSLSGMADRVYEDLFGTSPFDAMQAELPAYNRVRLAEGGG